ncbi:hypothetical protein NE237_011415 [Protea cynaroides]|uniref:EF-hand domain-containing protein n=1 Tax=Protea cynaroides TaxID=273540 RepID=A0A9Q0JX07_9MAGN|nr:hypothetical protein NE237_011415 [Protea cynaroides]
MPVGIRKAPVKAIETRMFFPRENSLGICKSKRLKTTNLRGSFGFEERELCVSLQAPQPPSTNSLTQPKALFNVPCLQPSPSTFLCKLRLRLRLQPAASISSYGRIGSQQFLRNGNVWVLRQQILTLGEKCSIHDYSKMMNSVDADGDGNVNFKEFKKMMTKGRAFAL